MFITVRSIINLSIADDASSNITRLAIHMPMACHEFVHWLREGDREERKKEKKEIFSIEGRD